MSFIYYFAGAHSDEVMQYQCSQNCNILRSYALEKADIKRWIERKKNGWKGNLLIDSGAYSYHRRGSVGDIDEYISWLNENDEYIDYFIVLDSIPGRWGVPKTVDDLLYSQAKSYENYEYMYERVKSPNKLLPVFHMGENFDYLIKYLEHQPKLDYMCLAGNKELTRDARQAWYSQCFEVIQKSSNANIQIHCLGSGTLSDVELFPFTSTDSTTWLCGAKSATVVTKYGNFYCGDDMTDKKHIIHNTEACDYVKSMCEKYNLDFNKIIYDFKERLKFNTHFYIENSANTSTTYYSRSKVTRSRLF